MVGGAAVSATVVHKPLFHWLLQEDHPVEWIQFTLLAFTVVAAALGAVRMARRGDYVAAALFVVFAFGALVLAGEEISWGQRVFGLGEPGVLVGVNDQHELNLHDIKTASISVDELSDYASIAMSAVLLLLSVGVRLPAALTGRRGRRLERTWIAAVSPALAFVPALALSAVYPWGQLVPAIGRSGAFWYLEEWSELCRYLALAGLAAVVLAAYRGRGSAGALGTLAPGADEVASSAAHPSVGKDRALLWLAVGSVVLTLVFVMLTIHTGIQPGNPWGSAGSASP
jgi:hypothetical protein